MNRKLFYVSFLFSILFTLSVGCQHARVRFPVPELTVEDPKDCKPPIKNQKACDTAREKVKKELEEKLASKKDLEKMVHIRFLFWGLHPKNIDIKVKDHCNGPIREIYQYSSFNDILWETFTLGVIMPKTVKITCTM